MPVNSMTGFARVGARDARSGLRLGTALRQRQDAGSPSASPAGVRGDRGGGPPQSWASRRPRQSSGFAQRPPCRTTSAAVRHPSRDAGRRAAAVGGARPGRARDAAVRRRPAGSAGVIDVAERCAVRGRRTAPARHPCSPRRRRGASRRVPRWRRRQLQSILEDRLREIGRLVEDAENDPSRRMDVIRDRLARQVAELTEPPARSIRRGFMPKPP